MLNFLIFSDDGLSGFDLLIRDYIFFFYATEGCVRRRLFLVLGNDLSET
jgi:hypothetical protein